MKCLINIFSDLIFVRRDFFFDHWNENKVKSAFLGKSKVLNKMLKTTDNLLNDGSLTLCKTLVILLLYLFFHSNRWRYSQIQTKKA